MARNSGSNLLLLASILIYAFVISTWQQTLLILLFGTVSGLLFSDQRDSFHAMFSAVARFITQLRPQRQAPLRSQLVGVCASIDQYPTYMAQILNRKKRLFFMLSRQEQDAAISTYKRLKEVEKLANRNHQFLSDIKQMAMSEFNISQLEIQAQRSPNSYICVDLIEHFVRDWASDTTESRDLLFEPVIKCLKHSKRILIPGSGLGRLAVELSRANPAATVDCVELAPEMYLGSKYATTRSALSSSKHDGIHKVYPHLLYFSHWRHGADQLEGSDLEFVPSGTTPNVSFSYQNFLTMNESPKYDAISTLFFLDTAQNVFSYIDKIHKLLHTGGVWCNYGPLKWGTAAYAELSVDEIIVYLESNGWKISELWENGKNRYNGSEKSMLDSRYKLIGWVARKL